MTVYIETGFNGDAQPMSNLRIGYDRPEISSITTSSQAAGFDAANVSTPRTDSAWRPTSATGAVAYHFDTNVIVSYMGVAKHDLGSQNATADVQIRTVSGGAWSTIPGLSVSPDSDEPLFFLFDPVSVASIRLNVTASDAAPTISVIAAGDVMEWPQPATWTGTPITEGDQISFSVNRTDTGNWAGRTKISDGLQFSVEVDNLSESFRSGDFKSFKAHANGEVATFFIAPRPADYPEEVSYSWVTDTARMERARPNFRNSGSVTLNCQGLRPSDR